MWGSPTRVPLRSTVWNSDCFASSCDPESTLNFDFDFDFDFDFENVMKVGEILFLNRVKLTVIA